MAIPDEEEHKTIINKNIRMINTVLTASVFILLCILVFKHTNIFDKSFIYLLLFIQFITFFVCNIKWNQSIMLYVHYLYCIVIYISLFSNNIYISLYFIFVIILNIYIWHINDDSCIFGGLDWGNDTFHYWGGYLFRFIPFIHIYKIYYLHDKSTTQSISCLSNLTETTTIQSKIIEDVVEKLPVELLDETISFDKLHDSLSKTITL